MARAASGAPARLGRFLLLRSRLLALCLLLVPFAALACGGRAGEPVEGSGRDGPPPGAWAGSLASDSAFGRLHARLSEPGAYFDTDNLISNEASYLHVIGALEERGVRGGAYIGVGPGQNFAYIAAVRPRIAFIVDIRRDNALQHLMFKALFEAAGNRIEYLCLLVGRSCPGRPADGGRWEERGVGELVDAVDAAGPDARAAERARRTVEARVEGYGIPLSSADRATIGRFHDAFVTDALDLRFSSHGRRPRFYYPTLRQLLLERDVRGRPGSYLATEEAFRYVKALSDGNLIVPVVGDLAGPRALAEIGRLLEARGETVSALYASNVEFYLWRQGKMDAFFANLERLPRNGRSVLIRSYFGGGFRAPHPERVPGYASTQLVEPLGPLLEAHRRGEIRSYWELVTGERGPAVREGASSG